MRLSSPRKYGTECNHTSILVTLLERVRKKEKDVISSVTLQKGGKSTRHQSLTEAPAPNELEIKKRAHY